MNVFINLVVFSTDIPNKKKFILSTDKTKIVFPRFEVNSENKHNIDRAIGNFLREKYVFLNDHEIMPQFIKLHSENLSTEPENIEMAYGSIVPSDGQINTDNCSWIAFEIDDEEHKTQMCLMIDVIRSLL